MIIEYKKSPDIIRIDRSYKITSKEIKKILRLNDKEDIENINLWQGRSPNEIEKGKSADIDIWEIQTKEQNKSEDKVE